MQQKPVTMEAPHPEATVRRCLYRDLDQLLLIYNYHISHTTASLELDTISILNMQQLYNSVLDEELPFLVVTVSNTHEPTNNKEDVLGYAYARYFRGMPGTVEIFIYLDPDATGQGAGKNLLAVLIGMLKASVRPGTDRQHGIREALAVVPEDEGRGASKHSTS